MRRRLTLPLVLAAALAIGTKCPAPPGPPPPDLCLTPLADDEPLCNRSAVGSAWGTSHRSSYAQASSPFAGPAPGQEIGAEHVILPGVPIALAYTSVYADGGSAIWGSPLSLEGAVVKIDHDPFEVIDLYIPAEREPDPPSYAAGISGAYNAVDRDDHFIVGRTRFLEVYADSVPGDRHSPIELVKRAFLPDAAFCRSSDVIAGMVLTYDDRVAFVTEQAVVGVIPREPEAMNDANLLTWSLNGAKCADETIPDEDLETVSNSLAADENGGVYLVTSEAMYRFRVDEGALAVEWRADYEMGEGESGVRLGEGSGSTPSLMGTRLADDRFVVITDGQDLMHLVLFWRDEIPDDWTPIAPGKNRRIACEVPVTFGDPAATRSLSEQSVLVRGYAAVVVNNLLQDDSVFDGLPPILRNAFSALEGGNPEQAPYGIERIDWDPATRSCETVWANPELSIPNGIPTMSQATSLFYGIGQREGVWGLEGVDFETGDSELFAPASFTECSQEAIDSVNPLLLLFIGDTLERLPASCENSFYAGTEVGPDGAIVTGTFQGASKYTPEAVLPTPPLARAGAGVRQGIDLCDRALAVLAGDPDRARDATRRAVVQLDAALEAFTLALEVGSEDPPRTLKRALLTRAASLELERASRLLGQPGTSPQRERDAEQAVRNARKRLVAADDLGSL